MTLPAPIPLAEAQARLLALVPVLHSETIPIADASGRYLAKDLIAGRTHPPADLSAMDGYAMPAGDTGGPWRIIGESAAGHPCPQALSSGEAVRISTGAIMPQGAGAILLQENALRDGDNLSVSGKDAATSAHIRRMGFDFAVGDCLMEAGMKIAPAQIALAISGGHGAVAVGSRPRICVIDSGDELASDPAKVSRHQVPASNGVMIASLAESLASTCLHIGPVDDELDSLLNAFEQVGDADVIVTNGGASVGDHDLVLPALEKWGATIEFWRVAVKPGKPLMVAQKEEKIVLGLPGNPVSSYVIAYLFLLPLLRHMAGARQPIPIALPLPLCTDLPATGPRAEFLRGRLGPGGVTPIGQRDSSAVRALATSDALIERPPHSSPAITGDVADVYLLQNGGNA
ncbi:molybdopterin biosynthesis protein [Aurantiacibacter atlanticus]|uniref:Molybdopterin molybdenumtransferase n=1 Tax=Aurantiacibacter atlanticus TaxID=1648404 RepID=A0A0H4VGL8_9SPHN|nr:molybdopterin molybdotransferase MoeA [Aurantiacibacter atlanticus]AKQ42224.1 molybdopterin biosynthesis protein [Aurantiacibacter atlanticus]